MLNYEKNFPLKKLPAIRYVGVGVPASLKEQ